MFEGDSRVLERERDILRKERVARKSGDPRKLRGVSRRELVRGNLRRIWEEIRRLKI